MKLIIREILCSFFIVFLSSTSIAQSDVINLVNNHMREGNFEIALSSISEYIEANPSDAQAYLKRAMVFEILGRNIEKKKDLQQANYLNPLAFLYISEAKRSNLYEKKSFDYDQNSKVGNFNKSPVQNDYYSLYLKDQLDLHSQDSLIEQAIYYLSKGAFVRTEKILSQLELNANILGIYYDLKGLVALKKNDLDDAIEYFTMSIDNMAAFPLAYHNRAIAYKLQGNYVAAKADLLTAIDLNEEISVFFFTLAKLSERLNDPHEAISFYKEAIDINPDYIEARTNYSVLQKTLGHYEESIDELMEISKLMGKDLNNHFIKGGIHLTYGEYEKAVMEFDIYLQEHSDDCDALFNRGLANILSGQKLRGCEDVYRSVEIQSNTKRVEILDAFCPNY
jgi:tetratricopeptide (TPR) repeat protein